MKTRSKTLIEVAKNILFNQRGEVGEEAEAVEEVVEEVSEEAPEEIVEEASDETLEVSANTEEELEEEIKDAIDDGASNEEIKDMIRQFTLKVDGKEFVKEVDLSNEEELTKQFQLAAKGQKSMQELQELKNLYSAQIERLYADPFAVLKEMNPDFDPLDTSARYIDKLTKEQEMSPEERQQLERQREFDEIKAERDRLKQEAQDKIQEQQRQELANELQTDIMSALDADADLVADRETVALVAENLMWANDKGMIDITAKDVIPTVKEQLRKNFQRSAARFKNVDSLKTHMGDDIINKLRADRVAKVQNQVKNVNSVNKDVSKPSKKKKRKRRLN